MKMTKNMIESIALTAIGLALTISSIATNNVWEVILLSVISLVLGCYCIYVEYKSQKTAAACLARTVEEVKANAEAVVKKAKKTTAKKATTKKATTKKKTK